MTDPQATPPPPDVDTSAIREIADRVYVILDRRVPLVPNIGIVLGDERALVIDTGMGNRNGKAVLEAARKIAGDRELILTITHFHPEHGYGADAFKGAARIVYNKAQADEFADKGQPYLDMFKGMGPAVADALADTALVAADELYDGAEHAIDLGGRTAILRTWGKAHTRGDQIVYLPDCGVLFTGDLAEEKTFPIFPWFPPHDMDIDGANWLKVLDDCLALAPATVVPGHGEIGDAAILSDVRDYIADVAARVKQAAASGKSEDEMIADLGPAIKAAHPDWHFPEWIDFAIRYFHARQA
jgi:glyoxylase-like metal-dependent hydrolase (beta-lactamase superfamily II)